MRVLFLGCGYLGYNLSELLSTNLDTSAWGLYNPYSDRSTRFQEVDAFDGHSLEEKGMEDAILVDTVSLVSNNAHSDNEEAFLENLCERYSVLFEQCKRAKIRRYVFISSGGTIYGEQKEILKETHPLDPLTLYGKSKERIEQLLMASGLPYLILRVSNPFGGYQLTDKRQGVIPILIEKAYQKEPFDLWADVDSIRDYLYITDMAKAMELLLTKNIEQTIVNLGSGQGHSLKEVIQEVEQATGQDIVINTIPSEVRIIEQVVLDISKLYQLTGFTPSVSLQEGIEKEVMRIKEASK